MFVRKLIPVLDSLFIILFCSVILGFYHMKNSNRDMERYFHKFERQKYTVIMACYTILMLSLWFNVRHVVMQLFKKK